MLNHQGDLVTIGNRTIPAQFLVEQEGYSLPEGAIGRIYEPGIQHTIVYPDRYVGAELGYPLGDSILARAEELWEAWQAAQPAPVGPTLEELKAAKIAEFHQLTHAEITAGFESSALGTPHLYSSELEDQINLIGSQFIASSGVDVSYVCTDADGLKEARIHTPVQLQQVYADGAAKKLFLIQKFHTLRADVESTSTAEELDQIAW